MINNRGEYSAIRVGSIIAIEDDPIGLYKVKIIHENQKMSIQTGGVFTVDPLDPDFDWVQAAGPGMRTAMINNPHMMTLGKKYGKVKLENRIITWACHPTKFSDPSVGFKKLTTAQRKLLLAICHRSPLSNLLEQDPNE